MSAEAAAAFARALGAALLEGEGAATRAPEVHAALAAALQGEKSVVLEVQFTGFTRKGQIVGGVDPTLLRAAGHLITHRVNRIGFTRDAGEADVAAFLRAAGRAPAALGEGGILAALAAAAPHGVYAGTTAGEGYRPPPRAEAPAPLPAASPASEAPSPAWDPAGGEDEVELAAFEILDPVRLPTAPPPVGAPAAPAEPADGGEPAGADMYHYFRTTDAADAEAERLPALLAAAETVTRFDELADAAARSVELLLRADAHAQAVALLEALVAEAGRADRTRFFRDSAVQALRRAGTQEALHRLIDYLPGAGPDRGRILRLFAFLGDDALALLEPLLFRGTERELRSAVFRVLVGVPAVAERLARHAADDPSPARPRALLELAREEDPELARRWAGALAAHRDPVVRVEAARTAAAVGGRGAVRVVVDLLADPERLVRREAVAGLGALGDAAAVPFLARVLGEGDEELQSAAAVALGRIGTADALPPLLALVQKRSLLPLRRASRARLAALQAIARIDAPAAREALQSVASGHGELADEARRLLAG